MFVFFPSKFNHVKLNNNNIFNNKIYKIIVFDNVKIILDKVNILFEVMVKVIAAKMSQINMNFVF